MFPQLKQNQILATALVGVALALGGTARGTVLIYDGFAAGGSSPATGQYVSDPASTTGGNNDALMNQGPTLSGFSGTWTGTDSNYTNFVYYRVNDTGLNYGSLQTTAGAVELFRSSGNSSSTKPLTRTTSFTGGDSVYFSLLLNYNFTHTTDVKFFPGANSISIGTNGSGQAVIRYAGGSIGNSVGSLSLNTTHLIVARVNDDDTFSLWLDPTDLSSEGANAVADSGSGVPYVTGSLFDSIQISTNATNIGDSTIFDEIRVGDSWLDVVPVPEPASATLVLLGLGYLAVRLRRR